MSTGDSAACTEPNGSSVRRVTFGSVRRSGRFVASVVEVVIVRNASRVQICLVVALIAASAGAVDAALGRIWDQLAILVAIAALCVAGLVLGRSGRPVMSIRSDLARWLRSRSAVEGERPEALLDRAVATYRRDHLRAPDRTP